MKWWATALVLCTYGVLKEFRPSEPYLYRYQQNYLNISGEVLNAQVYPYWTYSYLVFLIPVLLLTDILLYKPILVLESLSYISVWLTLIFGRGVLSQQVGQVLYGFATATEVAYFAYIYVKVDKDKYARVTVWTRAALQTGKCLAYFLSQLIMLELGDLLLLNYISLGSLSLTFFFAVALPLVRWRTVAEKKVIANPAMGSVEATDKSLGRLPKSYSEFVFNRVGQFTSQMRGICADASVTKWSLCWALTSCGDLQVGNYIQSLWGEAQKDAHNSNVYNGFVEGVIPLLSAITLLGLQKPRVDWDKWGELWLAIAALSEFAVLLLMTFSQSIYVMYAAYALFKILFQCMITVAQFNIVCRISSTTTGFVFGLNMFTALALQTVLTFVVVDGRGFALTIRSQFLVYSGFHLAIAMVFTGILMTRALFCQK